MFTEYATNYWMNASSTMGDTQVTIPSNFSEIARFAVYRSTSDGNFNSFGINITDCSLSLAACEYAGAHANGTAFSFGKTREIDLSGKNQWNIEGNIFTGRLYINESKADGIPALEVSWPISKPCRPSWSHRQL
jgi:hypothetical protein